MINYYLLGCLGRIAQRVEDTISAEGTGPSDGLYHVGIVVFVGSGKPHQVSALVPDGFCGLCLIGSECGLSDDVLAHQVVEIELG